MKPFNLNFPTGSAMPMPFGGELAFYTSDRAVCVMHWDRNGDSGFSLGDFDTWAEAVSAALKYQSKMAAEFGGCA